MIPIARWLQVDWVHQFPDESTNWWVHPQRTKPGYTSASVHWWNDLWKDCWENGYVHTADQNHCVQITGETLKAPVTEKHTIIEQKTDNRLISEVRLFCYHHPQKVGDFFMYDNDELLMLILDDDLFPVEETEEQGQQNLCSYKKRD